MYEPDDLRKMLPNDIIYFINVCAYNLDYYLQYITS